MKKILACMLTLVMVLALAVPVAADGGNSTGYSLFIKNDAPNHKYDAYQIFSGTLSADGTTLSNVKWGSAINDEKAEALITELAKIREFAALATDENKKLSTGKKAEVLAGILDGLADDAAALEKFAELVGQAEYDGEGKFSHHTYLGNPAATSGAQTTSTIGGEDVNGYPLLNLAAGYYLIKDRDNSVSNLGDFYTQYLVRVVKNENIDVKGQGVTVEKTVNDEITGDFDDQEDANSFETLYYQWEGTLPSNLANYQTYNYKFIDTMSLGLTFERYEQIYIVNKDDVVVHTFYDLHDDKDDNNTLPEGFIHSAPTEVREGDIVTGHEFSLEIKDLLTAYSNIAPTDKVIVKYSAYLNSDAKIDAANPNEVIVKYDNNPNESGEPGSGSEPGPGPEPGTTVPDEAYAYTFQVAVDKYDTANTNIKLDGVEFVLYKKDSQGNPQYAQVVTSAMVGQDAYKNPKTNLPWTADDVGFVYGYTSVRNDASVFITDSNGAILVKGLDAGEYFLEETKTKDKYNLLDAPVNFKIERITNPDGTVSTDYQYIVNDAMHDNDAPIGVGNSKGVTLPATGSMGTTIFYIIGGFLAVAALVLLITKKRMSMKE